METTPLSAAGSEAWAEQFTASLRAQRGCACEFLAAQEARMEQARLFVEQQLQQLEEELRQSRSENAELRQQLAMPQLQEQWREKLRQAEVELAVERAKIARQRAELEEQLRKAGSGATEPPQPADISGQAESPVGGRWLARMGLTAADRQSGRQL